MTKEELNLEEKEIKNVQAEMMLVGALYKKPELYISYGHSMRSKYDFSDDACRFFYNMFENMYTTFSEIIDEDKVNIFMSQNQERLREYKKYKGWKMISSWMNIADVDDFEKYYNLIKKYSLLREYERNGFPSQRIMQSKKFESMDANDIYRIVRSKADKINTVINAVKESVVLNNNVKNQIRSYLSKPEMGLALPWNLLNEMFRGCRLKKVIFNGFLSNEGKTRNMMLLMAYIVLVLDEKFLLLSNEMDEDDLRNCLITTVINNKCFQELHGVHINKPEREIVLGIYHDSNGNIIDRLQDKNGNFIETEEEYESRLEATSSEYNAVMQVAEWVDKKREGKLYFKDVGSDYSDSALEFEFRKHRTLYGIKYCGYDTLKGYRTDDWQAVKQTATKIKELMKEIDMFCFAVFQLTDDTVYTDIFQLSSNNIANAKQIKHVADALMLGKRLSKEEYHKYQYVCTTDWGEPHTEELNINKSYFCIKVDKNRGGSKDIIPIFEFNLDLNVWEEIGYVIKKR